MEYKVKKNQFDKEDIAFLEVFFDNGDCFPISSAEIVDFSLNFYDRLVLGANCWNKMCATIESGYIRLKLQKKPKDVFVIPRVCNPNAYKMDRITYIKNRLCRDGGVKFIKIFDYSYYHFTLYCNVEASMDGDNVVLNFVPHSQAQRSDSEYHNILLPELSTSLVTRIGINLVNGEYFWIDKSEIVDIRLNLNEELCCDESDYMRQVENGYLKIKLSPKNADTRERQLYGTLQSGIAANKQIEERLCGKDGFYLHEIRHIYVEYEYVGVELSKRESVLVPDVRRLIENKPATKALKDARGQRLILAHCGGCAEKLEKDVIFIAFGETALEEEQCRKELKKYPLEHYDFDLV